MDTQARDLLQAAVQARTAGDYATALQLLDDLHHRWHADALVHVRVHWQWFLVHAARREPLQAGWQLVALCFAAPASWVQRHVGIVRKDY